MLPSRPRSQRTAITIAIQSSMRASFNSHAKIACCQSQYVRIGLLQMAKRRCFWTKPRGGVLQSSLSRAVVPPRSSWATCSMVRKRRVGSFRAMDPSVCTAEQDNGPTRVVWYGQIEASGQTSAGRRPYPSRRLCIFARLAGEIGVTWRLCAAVLWVLVQQEKPEPARDRN